MIVVSEDLGSVER